MTSASKSARLRAKRAAERVEVTINGKSRWVHPAPPAGHGTPDAYSNYGCRCDLCRRANAQLQARTGAAKSNRAKRFAERISVDGYLVHPDPYGGHGSHAAYLQCGCRCAPCRATHADYMSEYRARS